MVVISCPIEGCQFQTEDQPMEIVVKLLELHGIQHTQQRVAPQTVATSAPKLNRPHIDLGINQETWLTFTRRWETYKRGSGISDGDAAIQLLQCSSDKLGAMLLNTLPDFMQRSEREVLQQMETIAVIKVAIGITRTELMNMVQDNDEAFRTFSTRVRGKAETCKFKTPNECQCGRTNSANYTEEVIKDVMLAGINDIDIRREVLGIQNIHSKTVNDIISLVESREMGRHATGSNHSVAAVSTFKMQKRADYPKENNKNKQIPCPSCKTMFSPYRKRRSGWNTKPFKVCYSCFRDKPKAQQNCVEKCENDEDPDEIFQQSSFQVSAVEKEPITLNKIIIHKKELRRAKVTGHPQVSFELKHVAKDQYIPLVGIADSGAQTNLWGLDGFKEAGFELSDLKPVVVKIRAANKNPIKILGAFDAVFKGISPKGKILTCASTIYVSDMVTGFFLSYDTMVDLLILSRKFPTIGECPQGRESCVATNQSLPDECPTVCTEGTPCECPQRSSVPPRPLSLPFEPIEENNDKMRSWILQTFASSTFNVCPHRPLQEMAGPPIEFHVKPEAKPRVCHKAATIPIHWQKRVRQDLERDEALGVIEKVPYGTPVTWCHRMVVTRKHDGTPRRTVDLSPLNRFCRRETYASEPPFQLARRVPRNSWKTVTDAWNGYHSVPLRSTDRHLTTFITPFGRYRYNRAPQGFVSSGDGYNRRFGAIIADFERKERCVDDTIHYDVDLREHWWRTIDFLRKVGSSGIVLNPLKFQFAQKNVEFAGFKISMDNIEPLPKFLDAIKTFPVPRSNTDVKSWFGLINQVSNYAQLRDLLAPFRPFLSPKVKFDWTAELNETFNKSKELIVDAIRHGVEIFDLDKQTCIRPDWSRKGVGYFLTQKHCKCTVLNPDCCDGGWRVVLAGSRFLSGAEKRYAAIEGEALAIAWGLDQSRYFTQGCRNLLVVTDHKPLVKIFGDRTLDEIQNSRLFRLKQRTLPWHFQIMYMPGTSNLAADAASRHPSSSSIQLFTLNADDHEELLMCAAITRDLNNTMAITWEQVVGATNKDPVLLKVMDAIEQGSAFQDPCLSPFARYRKALYIQDDVLMYKDRVVVPKALRLSVLQNLHAAHQGVSSMEQRAHSIVFWPGMTFDISKIRFECYECYKNAPSNSRLPSVVADPPSTPFEKIFGDFFSFGGNYYLVVGDRLSGWTEIFSTPTGSCNSGARGLVKCLRRMFSVFGVPLELSSDGGPEFKSDVTAKFLKDWDISHRVSSAYCPDSNGRAEVAVKSAKRLLRSNVGPAGSLDSDKFLRAMLQFRNTPDPDCSLSPAEIIFGHPLRDSFSFANRLEKYSNTAVRKTWRDAWMAKEDALRVRFAKTTEKLNEHARSLPPLKVGDRCLVQNQAGNSPKKWDRSGVVTEVLPFDQYTVKVDGSSRVTVRNRRFLKLYIPADTSINYSPIPLTGTSLPSLRDADDLPIRTDINVDNDIPIEVPDTSLTEAKQSTEASIKKADVPKVRLALTRLRDHNSRGLKELEPGERRSCRK